MHLTRRLGTLIFLPLVALIGAWEKENLGERLPKLLTQLAHVFIDIFVVIHLIRTLHDRLGFF